jgi:hypothetical protein
MSLSTIGDEENDMYYKTLLITSLGLLNDTPLEATKPLEANLKFVKKFKADPKELIGTYSHLCQKIIASLRFSETTTSTGSFVREMQDTPIFREYLAWYKNGHSRLLRYILTFLTFGKKAKIVDESLKAVSFRNWLAVEEELSDLVLPEWACKLAPIVSALLESDEKDEVYPKHGPGFVAERGVHPSAYEKCEILALDKKLSSFARTNGNLGIRRMFQLAGDRESQSVARLKFVPKDVSKARSICMEPTSYMYLQQGVAINMARALKRNTMGIIDIHDQGPNQKLALYGSIYGDADGFATLDLSDASDRVSKKLLDVILDRRLKLQLYSTRSSRVEDENGVIHRVKKFAPMGSAVCFPLQTAVFTSVVLLSMIEYVENLFDISVTIKDSKSLKAFIQRHVTIPGHKRLDLNIFRVYGDDIICDTKIAHDVISKLQAIGSKVNVGKSFTGDQSFRESCGKWYHEGHDVTPCRFTAPHFSERLSIKEIASYVAQVNNLRDAGLFKAASSLQYVIKRLFRPYRHIPFTDDPRVFGFLVKEPFWKPSKERYNPDLQRREAKVIRVAKPSTIKYVEDDVGELRRYLYSLGASPYHPRSTGYNLPVVKKMVSSFSIRGKGPTSFSDIQSQKLGDRWWNYSDKVKLGWGYIPVW